MRLPEEIAAIQPAPDLTGGREQQPCSSHKQNIPMGNTHLHCWGLLLMHMTSDASAMHDRSKHDFRFGSTHLSRNWQLLEHVPCTGSALQPRRTQLRACSHVMAARTCRAIGGCSRRIGGCRSCTSPAWLSPCSPGAGTQLRTRARFTVGSSPRPWSGLVPGVDSLKSLLWPCLRWCCLLASKGSLSPATPKPGRWARAIMICADTMQVVVAGLWAGIIFLLGLPADCGALLFGRVACLYVHTRQVPRLQGTGQPSSNVAPASWASGHEESPLHTAWMAK